MKMKTLLALPLSVFLFSAAHADTLKVEMLNKRSDGKRMVYSEDISRVNVGDTVTWVPTSKGHNVHFISGPDGFKLPKKSKLNKEYSMTFDVPGVYLYQCTPHKAMGMIALIVVGDDTSNKSQIAKTRVFGKSKKKLKGLIGEL